MANRLTFQTQLASIMEVLANAAVAEICKLVDDDYMVVSLQMSQCQRENKALKRKLHLMELKMARCFAERRLRDSSTSIGRARVHVGGNDRFRSSSTTAGVVFEGQMDMGSWPGRAAPGAASAEPTTCDLQQDTSVDEELMEAELVKQEMMEETEEEVQLISADGQLERGPGCSQVQRSSRPQQEVQADYHHSECPDPVSASTRVVEKEKEEGAVRPEIMLVKQEAGLETPDHAHPTIVIQEVRSGLPLGNTIQAPNQTNQELTKRVQGPSKRHVSVMLDGESPEIQMDSRGLYHCPFCTYDGPKYMVDNHIKGPRGHASVIYREFKIIKCGLGCRKTTHFHCCNCAITIINRIQFLKHLASHETAVAPPVTPLAPPVTPVVPYREETGTWEPGI